MLFFFFFLLRPPFLLLLSSSASSFFVFSSPLFPSFLFFCFLLFLTFFFPQRKTWESHGCICPPNRPRYKPQPLAFKHKRLRFDKNKNDLWKFSVSHLIGLFSAPTVDRKKNVKIRHSAARKMWKENTKTMNCSFKNLGFFLPPFQHSLHDIAVFYCVSLTNTNTDLFPIRSQQAAEAACLKSERQRLR